MGGLSLSDMYAVNAAGHQNQAGPGVVAPDAQIVGAANGSNGNTAAFSWVTLLLTLVGIRLLWEYAD